MVQIFGPEAQFKVRCIKIRTSLPSSIFFLHAYAYTVGKRLPQGHPEVQQRKILYMGLCLLIWGEAANVRFMPECLCYIFHNMAFELHGLIAGNVSIVTGENIKPSYGGDDEAFLRKVITPLYRVIEKKAKKSRNGKAPHSAWCNYDDLNEYFWLADCFSLGWPMCDDGAFFKSTSEGREVTQVIAIRDVIPPPNPKAFNDVYISTELMDTDLHQIIRSNQELSEEHSQYFLYQILRGLKYIHSANVIHRDLKPSNLLLNANCDLKICDFGLARPTSENEFMTEYVVTRWYRAPELLLNSTDYTAAIDVWSVGCIFMELMNRKPLFAGRDHMHQMRLLTELIGTPTEAELGFVRSEEARRYIQQLPRHPHQSLPKVFPHVHPVAMDLVERMLTFDPTKRITVEEALAHPYFARLHDLADEPICSKPFSFDFEHQALVEEQMKELIYKEAISLNPEYGQ